MISILNVLQLLEATLSLSLHFKINLAEISEVFFSFRYFLELSPVCTAYAITETVEL